MREQQINEAIERMRLLKLDKSCINAFARNKVWESESFGALYEVNDEEQQLIDEFEQSHNNCIVYHMIHNIFEFGECYTMLYVSPDTDEWEQDKADIKEGYAFAYVKNITADWCSEFGSVAIKPSFGGLVRLS